MREFANRNTGQGTDYWLGLDGARKDLAARQAQDPDRNRCQAIVFFTDGSLDIDRAPPDEQQHPIDARTPPRTTDSTTPPPSASRPNRPPPPTCVATAVWPTSCGPRR